MKRICLEVQPGCWLAAVLSLVLLPVRWVIAWFLAVVIHELGHYVALKLFAVRVNFVSVKLSGTYMHTAPMSLAQETAVAAMGPVFSLLLVLLSPFMPYMACCAFFQLLFNLLPLNGFDGWRVLGNFLKVVLPEKYVATVMKSIQFLLLAGICVVSLWLRWGTLVFIVALVLLVRGGRITFPCKRRKQIVQWSK